ncbi:MAG: (2,3-dihydroxybenzoyl)adenylate synthase [Acidimicrobiales bacterium]
MTSTTEVNPLIDGVVGYPDVVAARYRAVGYWAGVTHDDLLRYRARRSPDLAAIIDGERRFTYSELDTAVGRTATLLQNRFAIDRGDRVVVQLPNVTEFVVVVFALFRLGAIPVFALPAHRKRDLDHFVVTTDAVLLVTRSRIAAFDHADMADRVAADHLGVRGVLLVDHVDHVDAPSGSPADRSPADLLTAAATLPEAPTERVSAGHVAFLQLSGGTTGIPKLIARTHDDYLYSVRESARICGLSDRSRMLVAMPIAHNFTMSSPGILGIIWVGGAIILTEDPSPPSVLHLIERHQVTIIPAVPPLVISWLNAPERAAADVSSLEVLQVGGAKLSRAVAERVAPTFGCRLQQVFGMAEGLVCYTRLDDDNDTIVSTQGRPISAADEIRVVDEHDQPVAPGTPGALLVRGPYTIRGYFRAPEHNARTFTADGFYRTGDLVVQRSDGYLTVVGRTKDQINRGGEKIAPEEVENALLAHPDVHDVSVVGLGDEVLGERIHAFVVARSGAVGMRPVDLRRFLAAVGLAEYKVPDSIEFVRALPETGVGKVDRARLGGQARPRRLV